ncbi:MAG TPA: hypothetical protein VGZ47_08995 [Gemmataceae bacterium]|jgi:hypothetical protein|nr:hypothetical protein [Gemmataceae bacterium]
MGSLVFLIAGAWMAAQSEPAEPNLLRLQKEQEFVYRGYYTLTSEQPGSRNTLTWNLQHCVLIRNVGPRGADAAFLTIQRKVLQPGTSSAPVAQLEQATIEPTGKVVFQPSINSIPRIPPDGPPNLEIAAFVELPKSGLTGPSNWITNAENGLPQTWKIQGVEDLPGNHCVVLTGEQASPAWKNGAGLGWFRQDKVWLDLSAGYAVKIERTICRREEGGLVVTGKAICALDDGVPTPCPGGLLRDRWNTIVNTLKLMGEFEKLQLPPGAPGVAAYDELLAKIDHQLKLQADSPYREAMVTLRRRVELARQGERPPEPLVIPAMKVPLPADPGEKPDADWVLTDLASGQQTRLSRLRGKPVALFFFQPTSPTAGNLLCCAQELSGRYAGQVHVLAVAMEGAPPTILALRNDLRLTIGVFTGPDARRLFPVETTPCIVILDPFGAIRFSTLGWGGEYPDWLGREMEKVVHPAP